MDQYNTMYSSKAATFDISDDTDHVPKQVPDEDWAPEINQEELSAEEKKIWHRYRDPDTKNIWFYCATQSTLWFYESEIAYKSYKDGRVWFYFQGMWQEIAKAPLPQPTAEGSTSNKTQLEEKKIFHRYRDPDTANIWYYCSTQPQVWFFESEIACPPMKRPDGRVWFCFQGDWQEIAKAPLSQPTDEGSTSTKELRWQ